MGNIADLPPAETTKLCRRDDPCAPSADGADDFENNTESYELGPLGGIMFDDVRFARMLSRRVFRAAGAQVSDGLEPIYLGFRTHR